MRLKTRTWIVLAVLLCAGAVLYWHRARSPRADSPTIDVTAVQPDSSPITPAPSANNVSSSTAPVLATNLFIEVITNGFRGAANDRFAYRLNNSTQPLADLSRNERAVLLRNALIDTALAAPKIPEHLRVQGDPGSYIVQARGLITEAFRAEIGAAGGEIVSYVPNNAYLVRANAGVARALEASPWTQKVLPFEPYYKLDSALLRLAVKQELSPHGLLNVVSFPGQGERMLEAMKRLGAEPVGPGQATAFGEVWAMKVPADKTAAAAQVPEVQMLAVHFEKRPVNDLTRVITKISTNVPTSRPPQSHYQTSSNFLTGAGVVVAVADTGVDDLHPDLIGRIEPQSYTGDFDGHGTHVTGTFIGNGAASLTVSTPPSGSVSNAIFSGMAPEARAYVQDLGLPDSVLQRNTALKGALISNNSWGFGGDNEYDIFAASYDAAVRDSLPGVTGEQQVAYVFAAGNDGAGGNDGLSGLPGSIVSPGTGKNVITVGGSDLPRHITNEVYRCTTVITPTATNVVCDTNFPWAGMTDTNNQVATFSSRGNVGIGLEGVFGRFKPDVVAPGAMVVSARSGNYTEPDGETNTFPFQYNNLTIGFDQTNVFALVIPPNAIRFEFLIGTNALSPTNLTLLIGADYTPAVVPTQTIDVNNPLRLTPPVLRPGLLYYTLANTNHAPSANYDLILLLTVTNNVGTYYTVLKQLNAPLMPNYRYEAGTSMAAPAVSGFLALMQQYLGSNFNIRPSPALLKALVINGARSLSPNYNLQINAPVNHQGWGLVNMSNSVPFGLTSGGTNGPMRFYDQTLTNSLATGGTETYEITVPPEAQSFPLRMTLVWTDPPGNPVTGIKLVNDMNLSVLASVTNTAAGSTNLGTNELIWLGNNFPPGSDFTEPIPTFSTDTNVTVATNLAQIINAKRDFVNNVENVYLQPPLASRYTVVVKAHRVNVQAVNSHTNSLAQDYALVIASGNVVPTNNVNLLVTGPNFTNDFAPRITPFPQASVPTNGSTASSGLLNQRVGANNPLIVSTNGASNQWAFFIYSNVPNANFTNVAILTFFPPELSLPRFREADIDLYVARAPNGSNLFQLADPAIGASVRSTTRGGSELVVFSNAQPNEVFYVGVKSEDQQAANFNIYALSSDKPFSSRDASNNIIARAIPLPADIPDGSPEMPGGTNLIMIVVEPPDVNVQRAYVTNRIYHEEAGDLVGIISHSDGINPEPTAVTLNNHRTWTGYENPNSPYNVVYDDSEQGDLDDGTSTSLFMRPDGPGRLLDFIGHPAFGVWNYTISDNAIFHTGVVEELTLVLQPASTNADDIVDLVANIRPNGWLYAGFRVPADATNVQVCVTEITPSTIPVEGYIRRGFLPTRAQYDKSGTNIPPANGFCFNYGVDDLPPLSAGQYFVGVFNPDPALFVRVHLVVTIQRGLTPDRTVVEANNTGTDVIDDATTNSFLFVTNQGIVTSVEVDVRLNHPRIADLTLHLSNPSGTRLNLAENRGRDTTEGYGVSISNVVVTNFMARVLDTSWEEQSGEGWVVGQIISGWRVDQGDVDIHFGSASGAGGFFVPSHTGTNALDLVGVSQGAVSTNLGTVAGKTYLLSWAYCKNRNVSAPQSARLDINGQFGMNFSYTGLNGPIDLKWLPTNYVFRATSNSTQIAFSATSGDSEDGGIFLDTIRMDEVEITTNSLLYATFTDNALKALLPIKFAPPPFGDTNYVSTNVFISGFEGTNGGRFTNRLVYTNFNVFTNGQTFDGWRITTNTVYVQTNSVFAYSDTNYLLLRTGRVSRVLSNTVQGKEYVLQFATRVAPRRLIYSTGVDEDALALLYGSVDSHYFVSSNTFTGVTNRAFVLASNTPPLGATWINRNLSDSRWIGVNPTNPPPGTNFYGFKTRFNLTGYKWTNATLTGRFQVDGEPGRFRLNGTNVAAAFNIPTGAQSYENGFVARTFTNGFLPGMNTFEIVVPNATTPTTNTAMGVQAFFAADAIKAPLLFSNIAPPLESAVGEVRLAGCYTNYFTALSDGWHVQNVTFVAASNNVLLEFTGITPGVWLDHVQIRETGRKYFQPEEPMTPFVGQPSRGVWNLEVWDNRLGAVVTNSSLISWRLHLNFVRTNPPFFRLGNGPPAPTLTIGTNAVRYFTYDVPCASGTVSNWLVSLTLPNALDLYFNQNTFPLTGAFGDFPLLLNTTNGVSYLDVGVAPLFRSGRYFLAVRNTNAVPVDFRLTTGMFDTPCPPPPASLVAIGKSGFGPGGFILEWEASPEFEFTVQYASDPLGPWIDIPKTITSGDGQFSFTDDGTLTGGLTPPRFYRLLRQ